MLNIPETALYDRKISKNRFYKEIDINSKLERKFIDEINHIIWKYKIAKETVNLEPTEEVKEIQVFEISLKEKDVSKEVLENIDRIIPYPILYILRHQDDVRLTIAYKEQNKLDENKMVINSYYQSEWTKEQELNLEILKGLTLKDVYDNILKQLIPIKSTSNDDIENVIELNEKQEKLKKEILKLENSIRREKQFNRKVEMNIELQKKRAKLERFFK